MNTRPLLPPEAKASGCHNTKPAEAGCSNSAKLNTVHFRGRSFSGSPAALVCGGTITVMVLIMLLFNFPARAQDASPAVTADDVNVIASKMYCPVCENIPLDVCPTAACAQWRDEIRAQLEAGQAEEQIIADFVARYGDRVVGTPQDPTLRALSLVTPWLVAAMAVMLAGGLLLRWWRGVVEQRKIVLGEFDRAEKPKHDDDYRAQLERDLAARR